MLVFRQDNIKSLQDKESFKIIFINIRYKDLNNYMTIKNFVLRFNLNVKKDSCYSKNFYSFDYKMQFLNFSCIICIITTCV